jgi:hypothetical protein
VLLKGLLKEKTQRDKQKMIGPSGIGNLCDKCVGRAVLQRSPGQSRYWLGARIGTAVHAYAESQINAHYQGVVFSETRVTVADVPGLGVVAGTADAFVPGERLLVDFKTTSRKKLSVYKTEIDKGLKSPGYHTNTLKQYLIQTSLYAYGMNHNTPEYLLNCVKDPVVEKISIQFVARDGLTDSDFFEWSFPYHESNAVKALERLERITTIVNRDNSTDALKENEWCYNHGY